MEDYGIRTSKKGASAISATGADVIMSTRFPFAKIDPTQTNSFRTTTITFLNDPTPNTIVQFYSFAHGYDRIPQVWGLWNVTWGASVVGSAGLEQNGYGTLTNGSGIPSSTLMYKADEENINMFVSLGSLPPVATSSLVGTSATLTTYVFVDDLQEAAY